MALPFMPGNSEILDLLASHVSGPYRFVHHNWVPYVRVGPSTATEPITIRSSPRLTVLTREGQNKRLQGLNATIDLTVVFHGEEIRLVETPFRASALDALDEHRRIDALPDEGPRQPRMRRARTGRSGRTIVLGRPLVAERPEGISPAGRQPRPVIRVGPDPTPAPPPSTDAPMAEALQQLVARADLHPEEGDYLVLPTAQADAYAPLPTWVAMSPDVTAVHVIKPRLGTDESVGA